MNKLAKLFFGRKDQESGQTQEQEQSEIPVTSNHETKGIVASVVHGQGARNDQEDSYGISDWQNEELCQKKGVLAVVADGMGGLTNGGQASSLVVNTCQSVFQSLPDHIASSDMLLDMAIQSNMQMNHLLKNGQRSGSTLVSVIVRNGYLHFLAVGDSRIYLYRSGALIQLNREHIYKEELALMAVNGMISPARIYNDPQVKAVTSYFGNGKIAYLDRNLEGIRLLNKDRIILASDGIFGTLIPEQMEKALALPIDEAAEEMNQMIIAADKKHQDNYTALILEYRE